MNSYFFKELSSGQVFYIHLHHNILIIITHVHTDFYRVRTVRHRSLVTINTFMLIYPPHWYRDKWNIGLPRLIQTIRSSKNSDQSIILPVEQHLIRVHTHNIPRSS